MEQENPLKNRIFETLYELYEKSFELKKQVEILEDLLVSYKTYSR